MEQRATILHLQASVEFLLAKVSTLEAQVQALQAENQSLKTENQALRAQLNQNSHNSHLPPASDRFVRQPAFARVKGGKRGGKEGHAGHTLELKAHADQLILLSPPDRCSCGAELPEGSVHLMERRQVLDLPPTPLRVVEYQQYGCQCTQCGKQVKPPFPTTVSARVQYGAGIHSLLSLLSVHYHLSYGQIGSLFEDLFGHPVNVATILSANQRTYQALAASEAAIQAALLQQEVVHFDETGLACQEKTYWLHTASTALFTYLFVHAQRGLGALESSASLLKRFTGLSTTAGAVTFPFANVSTPSVERI